MNPQPMIHVDGRTLTLQEILAVAEQRAQVQVSEDAWPVIHAARAVVERIVQSGETVYGINTGFGALVRERISQEDLAQLQVNLVRSHATALGEPMSVPFTRAMMLIRVNSLCKGHSGIHPDCIHQLITFLNEGIHPVVPRIGSLGASGDLAPLSHLALALMGEGHVWSGTEQLPTAEVLFEKGILPVQLTAKDGLSLINGTAQMSAFAALAQQQLESLLLMADVILAASLDARSCSLAPYRPEVHEARPHGGQRIVSARVRQLLASSEILLGHQHCDRVQDPYSFRCAPQVHGAVMESHSRLADMLTIEINSATDNPLIFPDPSNPGQHEVVSQGNFHGEIVGLTCDAMSLGLFELGSISERRMDQLLDPSKSELPAFLAKNSGLESGLMIVQYVAGSALAELHGQCTPRTAFSTSTSAGQEDHVSMGATAAWNLHQGVQRLSEVLACEALIAVEALDQHQLKSSPYVECFRKLVRTISAPLCSDRSTSAELQTIAKELLNGSWVARLEAECGRLPR
jgi:histidine ammonia-lyase